MSSNKRLGNKLPFWADKSTTTGVKLDPGPFLGVIKNNIDPTNSGRLQVYIPDLGGDESNVQNWRTVSYASPFFGATNQPEATRSTEFEKVQQTYGMWMVPPDVGNEVLCTFVNGDPGRGYWFACVNKNLSHAMLPATGTAGPIEKDKVKSQLVKNALAQKFTPNLPVVGFNENDPANITDGFKNNKKAIHETQAEIVINQGLDKDTVRGTPTSSSSRETPSQVFGISTPGRPINDPADDANYGFLLASGEIDEEKYAIRVRKGGHSFIMDDGEIDSGRNQLVRLRTAGGHQILMNDSDRILYIANSDGSAWLEFTGSGHINMYSAAGMNFRTEGDFNLHSSGNIRMHSEGSFNVRADQGINLDTTNLTLKASEDITAYAAGNVKIGSGGDIVLDAASKGEFTSGGNMRFQGARIDLNNGPGQKVKDPGNIALLLHPDVSRESELHPWISVPNQITSITTIAPGHEPWPRNKGYQQNRPKQGGEQIATQPAPSKTPAPAGEYPRDIGPDGALGKPPSKPLDPSWLTRDDAPNPPGGVGNLSQYETKALMAQIAYSESSWNYRAKNSLNYVGRYQTGAAVLSDQGYIKKEYFKQYKNGAVNYPEAWTGKDGISSLDDYFNNKGVQERVMYDLMQSNYKTMVRIGAIKSTDDKQSVAGMLQVAHLLGAGGAKTWRNTGGGADANGTSGEAYFNKGRYAVNTLATGTATG
jgi:hypothetical protein